MPRNTVDTCIICSEVDCRCNKVPKKVVPKKTRPSPPTRVAPTRVAPRGGVAKVVLPEQQSQPKPTLPQVKSASQIERELLANAITCFAAEDMLHRDELVKHRDLIHLPQHRIDAMIWKQDNNAANERNELRR